VQLTGPSVDIVATAALVKGSWMPAADERRNKLGRQASEKPQGRKPRAGEGAAVPGAQLWGFESGAAVCGATAWAWKRSVETVFPREGPSGRTPAASSGEERRIM
jgi:hypothetical protein